MLRRLPVYVLLDCSESMAGPSIQAVQDGLQLMISQLRKNPYALETVYLSVIAFNHRARQIVPLTEIPSLQLPALSIRPGTALGEALSLLVDCIKRETIKTTREEKGDYRPLVFLITDGQPTDRWRDGLARLDAVHPRPANIYAIGCGEEVDFEILGKITECVFHMKDMSPEKFAKFFVWMSASVQSASQGMHNEEFTPPPMPEGCVRLDKDSLPSQPEFPLQVFIHSRCSTTRQPYLMRYVFSELYGIYVARAAHPLDEDFFSEGVESIPPIPSEMIGGQISCPHCGNPNWICCGGCNQIFCATEPVPEMVICPKCQSQLTISQSSSFRITRSVG